MTPGNEERVCHLPAMTLACVLTLGLGACDRDPSAWNTGREIDRAVEQDARAREQAVAVAHENANRASAGEVSSVARTPGDLALIAKVKSALNADPGLKALAIEVNVVDGSVILYGTADTPARRDRATQAALNVDGVRSVTNHLFILKGS